MSSPNDTGPWLQNMPSWTMFSYILMGSLCAAINSVFSFIIFRYRGILPVTSKIVGSMFVAGILFSTESAIVLPVYITIPKNDVLYIVVNCEMILVQLSSVLHLFAAALERYVCIVYPLRHDQLFSPRNVWIVVILCWTLPFGLLPIFILLTNHLSIDMSRGYCEYMRNNIAIAMVFDAIVAAFYLRIYVIARKQRMSIAAQGNQSKPTGSSKPILILFATAAYSFLLWTVDLLITLGACFESRWPEDPSWTYHIPLVILTLHPLVYGFGNRTLRNVLFKTFRRHTTDSEVTELTK